MWPPPNLLCTLVAWVGTACAGCTAANPAFAPAVTGADGPTPHEDGPPADAAGPEAPPPDAAPPPADASDARPTTDGSDDATPSGCQSPVAVAGTGLNAEFFDNSDFTGTRVARIDQTIDWSSGTAAPDPTLGPDTFSGRWTGKLLPSVSGPHTFRVTYNDGARLLLDDRVVIYRWGTHNTTDESATVNLIAGRKYDLKMEFFDQNGSAVARLEWQTPCQARQVIPTAHLYPEPPVAPTCVPGAPPGTGTGLSSEYFGNEELQPPAVPGPDARVDHDWGAAAPVATAGFPVDHFSARWRGWLQAPVTGPLTIYYQTENAGRLWLDGTRLVDSWSEMTSDEHEVAATIDVVAGQMFDIRVEYKERDGNARARLWWSWPCQDRQIIPIARLYPPTAP